MRNKKAGELVIHKVESAPAPGRRPGSAAIVQAAAAASAAWTLRERVLTGLRDQQLFHDAADLAAGRAGWGPTRSGNRYYRERGSAAARGAQERRWVVFANAPAEPTTVPPGWVGWLHKRIEKAPSEQPLLAPKWEREPAAQPDRDDGRGPAARARCSAAASARRRPATTRPGAPSSRRGSGAPGRRLGRN